MYIEKNGKGLEAIKLGENRLENCPSLHKMWKKASKPIRILKM